MAIKLENRELSAFPKVENEERVYEALSGRVGIPKMRLLGEEGDFYFMISDLLGPSLQDLFVFCDRKFSLKTVLLLADQMIRRIKQLHNKSFLHLDIKPANFLMGTGRLGNLVHIIDFGMSREYIDYQKNHIPYREGLVPRGTYPFVSINTHLGIGMCKIKMCDMDLTVLAVPSRRDDLESLGYVLIYLHRGFLPWLSPNGSIGVDGESLEVINKVVKEKKMNISIEDLCKGLPSAFASYFKYVRALRFDARPDYTYLLRIFRDLYTRQRFSHDYMFDWTVKQFSIVHGRADQPDQPSARQRGKTARQRGKRARRGLKACTPTKACATKEEDLED